MSFNKASRTENALRSSSIGVTTSALNVLMAFVYRAIFVHFLSASYLGLNGLFTNVLQILSLADLGISTAIIYRFYDPISNGNTEKVGELMHFFKTVYTYIALIILSVGLCLLPFIQHLIKDPSEVPAEINLKLIYVLFLLQTVASYTYAYKQSLLSADQRQHLVSLIQFAVNLLRYLIQTFVLFLTRDFTLVLACSVVTIVLVNFLFSLWITRQYKEVFAIKSKLSKEEKKAIMLDTKACMFHKVGGTVLNATDNVVLTKFVSLIATGFYSNYTLITSNLNALMTQLFNGFVASIGNSHIENDREQNFRIYRKLLFMNFWIASVVSLCFYLLIDDFVSLWVGNNMVLGGSITTLLSLQFYLEIIRLINISYTNACGLFVKDQYRPLIESAINLGVSIVLAIKIGISGVILGTIVSHILTVTWRDPYILYKFEFKRSVIDYWKLFAAFTIPLFLFAFLFNHFLASYFSFLGVIGWLLKAICVFVLFNGILLLLFFRTEEFKFFLSKLTELVKKFKR